jgi:hypothetical protein
MGAVLSQRVIGMGRIPLFLLLIALGLLVTLIIRKQIGFKQLHEDVQIYGMRIKVSLDEIYSTLNQPGGLGSLEAIKDNSTGKVIWTSETDRPPINTAYYEIGDYTIFGTNPININLESIPFLENDTREKLRLLYKRDVFLRFVDKSGVELNSMFLIVVRMVLIVGAVFVFLAAFLMIHRTFFGSWQKDEVVVPTVSDQKK